MLNLALGENFKNAATFLSFHSTAVQSVLKVSAVAGINQIIKVTAFQCPCIMEADLKLTCNSSLRSFCPRRDKAEYSYLFIFGPAVILFMLGFMVNEEMWRNVTGCCSCSAKNIHFSNTRNYGSLSNQSNPCTSNALSPSEENNTVWKKQKNCPSALRISGFAFIAPLSWILLCFIDGEYLACALTSLPYSFKPNQTCENTIIDKLLHSNEFFNNYYFSQKIGWILAMISALCYLIVYACIRTCSSMNYIQAKVSSKCQSKMEQAIIDAFTATIVKRNPENREDDDEKILKTFVRDLKKKDNFTAEKFWKDLKAKLSEDSDATKLTLNKIESNNQATSEM